MTVRFILGFFPRPGRALLILAATAILATGCATVTPGQNAAPLGKTAEHTAAPQRAPQAAPQVCQVELRSKSGKSQVRKVELTGDQHVGDVLAETGALRKYSNCEVSVLRAQPGGGMAKMNVNLAPNKRQVKAESDYFLYPNDRLVVHEVDSTIVEEMMGGMMGSMARRK